VPRNNVRQGRWITPAGKTWSPSAVVSVVVQTASAGRDNATGHAASRLLRVHVAEAHRHGEIWTIPHYRSFDIGDAFHDWLEMYASHRRRTYIFSPGVMDALTLTGWWSRIEQRGCILRPRVRPDDRASGRIAKPAVDPADAAIHEWDSSSMSPDTYIIQCVPSGIEAEICRYSTSGKSFQWTRCSQYITASEEEIARAIGHQWLLSPGAQTGTSTVFRSPQDRSFLWCKWFMAMSDWWRSIDGGPWGATTAGLAYSFLRKRIRPRTVLHHNDERCGVLESAAMFGGRRACWYLGNIGSEYMWEKFRDTAPSRSERGTILANMYHYDIRSMYPFLLSRMQFPIERIAYYRSISVDHCRDMLDTHGVIADVSMRSTTPEYPLRRDNRTIYPIGSYRTTLAGPELQLALATGDAYRVHRAAVYRLGTPFAAAADPLLAMRREYRDTGERGWEMLAKQIANSMTGRLAPRQSQWYPRPTIVPIVQWGPWRSRGPSLGEVRYYRSLAGMTWERILSIESIRPMGAAYAYLTAYGRTLTRGYRQMLDPRTILAQDTDGIWVIDRTLESLTGSLGDIRTDAGEVYQSHVSTVGRFFGPQHYWYGDGWVLSGMRTPIVDPGTCTAHAHTAQPVVYTSPRTPDPLVFESHSHVGLHEHGILDDVDEHGWVNPPRVFLMDD
jgi:hypothetical protein